MTPLILLMVLHAPLPLHTVPAPQAPKFTVGYVCEAPPKKAKRNYSSLRRAGQRRAR